MKIRNISRCDLGLIGVASVTPKVDIGNPNKNVENILTEIKGKDIQNTEVVVLPELSLTGYSCADLFFQDKLLEEAQNALVHLCLALKDDTRFIAVGLPLIFESKLFNCAAVISNGEIVGIVPKTFIPNYQEFYEKRWFASGKDIRNKSIVIQNQEIPFGTDIIFEYRGTKIGIEICEDLWVPIPPSSRLCKAGAEILLNLSATDDNIGKYDYIKSLVVSQSARCRCAYVYSSAGRGESSTDLVFSGINLVANDGALVGESSRFDRENSFAAGIIDVEKLSHDRRLYSTFSEGDDQGVEYRIVRIETKAVMGSPINSLTVNPHPFIPSKSTRNDNCREIVHIQSWGLEQRLLATGCRNLVVGISGGLDSTLALLVAHHSFKRLGFDLKNILGVTMPAAATSARTHSNARKLIEALGVTFKEIPINEAVRIHFQDIGHSSQIHDAVYENSQARERTQILMDLANGVSGMVLGTGDMSELALGWCTYNGDQMSMYNVNGGVPKTLVKYLVKWFASSTEDAALSSVLLDIIDTPISPELIPSDNKEISQKTEELVGPYELHDFFLFHMLRNGFSPFKIFVLATIAFEDKYSPETIKKWLMTFFRRFFSQQFKRSCMPDSPKIGSVCLSPRGDWRMPSDASAQLWINEAEAIEIS